MNAAATARRLAPELTIRALERRPYASYSACGIPYFVAGLFDDSERLISRTPEEFAEQGIEVVTEGRGGRQTSRDGSPGPTSPAATPPSRG